MPDTQSTVKLTTLVHGLEPRIDVTAEIDWREIGDEKRGIPGLRVGFDAVSEPACYETPFGSVVRSLQNEEEVPTLRYAHTEGMTARCPRDPVFSGITLLQDSKYGHSQHGGSLYLRVIRSSFDPDHAPEVNKQTVRYSLVFHATSQTPADLTRLGAAWNHPLLVFPGVLGAGDGHTPPARSFVSVENPNVVLSALKMPEGEPQNGLLLRLVELNGEENTEAIVHFDPALVQGFTIAHVCDLMEQPLPDAPLAVFEPQTGVLRVAIRAHSFVTVRLE